jgi:hypothetical protein
MDAEINNVIYMELYSGANMVDDKYLKTNNVRSIDRDSTVTGWTFKSWILQALGTEFWHQTVTPELLMYKTYKNISKKPTA